MSDGLYGGQSGLNQGTGLYSNVSGLWSGSVGLLSGAGTPAFSLDFTTGSLPAGVTLTRASTGSRINASGVFVLEAIDTARFNYSAALALQGVLAEPTRQNVFVRSAEFDNASWTKTNATVTADQTTAPDGNTAGDKLFENTTNAAHYVQQTFSATSGTVYTFSVYGKLSERSVLGIACNQIASAQPTYFNLSTGAVGTVQTGHTASIEDVGGGWYRCRITITASSTATASFRVHICSANGVFSYAGVGTNGIFIWGAQMEAASTPTTLYPTTTAAATRQQDQLAFTVPAGVSTLRYTFSDLTTQDVAVSPGAYIVPTNLNRTIIRTIAAV